MLGGHYGPLSRRVCFLADLKRVQFPYGKVS